MLGYTHPTSISAHCCTELGVPAQWSSQKPCPTSGALGGNVKSGAVCQSIRPKNFKSFCLGQSGHFLQRKIFHCAYG